MELIINQQQVSLIEWNHEEIKQEVSEKVEYYKTLVYTEAQIKDAKADRATLNKFVSALEEKRKEIKKQCMEPYEQFEEQVKEIIAIVNEPIALIDNQIKEFDDKKKEEKLAKIKEFYESTAHLPEVTFERVYDPKMLNTTYSMKQVESTILSVIESYNANLAAIRQLPEFSFEAEKIYNDTWDIHRAITEAKRMSDIQKEKAAYEQQKIIADDTVEEEPVTAQEVFHEPIKEEPQRWEVIFKVQVSTAEAQKLRAFLEENDIKFEAVIQ